MLYLIVVLIYSLVVKTTAPYEEEDPELDKVNPPSVLMLRNLQYWLSLIVLSRRGTSR